MASQRRAARLAEAFDESYPDALPLRLAWLADHLGVDRARFLWLIGLAPDEVEANLDAPWERIVERWEVQASWVEELCRQLIAFFGYDWRALADRLHEPARPVERLQVVSPARREEALLTRIREGGPDVLVWLVEYLAESATNGAVSKGRD